MASVNDDQHNKVSSYTNGQDEKEVDWVVDGEEEDANRV